VRARQVVTIGGILSNWKPERTERCNARKDQEYHRPEVTAMCMQRNRSELNNKMKLALSELCGYVVREDATVVNYETAKYYNDMSTAEQRKWRGIPPS
jgi:uncharacterized protein YfaP (DUF2135 family)